MHPDEGPGESVKKKKKKRGPFFFVVLLTTGRELTAKTNEGSKMAQKLAACARATNLSSAVVSTRGPMQNADRQMYSANTKARMNTIHTGENTD